MIDIAKLTDQHAAMHDEIQRNYYDMMRAHASGEDIQQRLAEIHRKSAEAQLLGDNIRGLITYNLLEGVSNV